MSFNQRGRRGGMSGWSSHPLFNMLPLELISNLVSPVLDIVSPLEDINELMNQSRSWYQVPMQKKNLQLIQKRGWQTTPKVVSRGQKLPQKYRIVIDCTGFNPNTLKTCIKCVQDNKHLIIFSDMKKGRQFKRSYTLPKEVETKKLTKFVTPNKQFVVEFCYLDTPNCLDINLQPKICKVPEGKCVHVNVPIPEFVDPAKVLLHVKGRELIVRHEERLIPYGDSCCRVMYHNRVKLPENTNVNAIKAKSDKHKLTILAPVGNVTKGTISQQLRNIPIQRKLRHRKMRSVSRDVDESKVAMKGESIIGKQQKLKKPVTPLTKSKTTTIGKKLPITQKSTISEKKPINIAGKSTVSGKKSAVEPTTSKKKSKSKTSTTISGQTEHSPVRSTEKGSDILKKVFDTSDTTQKRSGSEERKKQTGEIGGLQSNITSEHLKQKL